MPLRDRGSTAVGYAEKNLAHLDTLAHSNRTNFLRRLLSSRGSRHGRLWGRASRRAESRVRLREVPRSLVRTGKQAFHFSGPGPRCATLPLRNPAAQREMSLLPWRLRVPVRNLPPHRRWADESPSFLASARPSDRPAHSPSFPWLSRP